MTEYMTGNLREYAMVEMCDITENLLDETMICFDGVVTKVDPEKKNKRGSQRFVEISNGDCTVQLLVFQNRFRDCKLAFAANNQVRVFGKIRGWNNTGKLRKILGDSVGPNENKIEVIAAKKWNGLTPPEILFLRTQRVADSNFILCQVPVGNYIADFVVYRRDDLSPVIVIEIDGDSHITNRINDAIRDREIKEILGVDVCHITAAQVYEDDRKKRISQKMDHRMNNEIDDIIVKINRAADVQPGESKEQIMTRIASMSALVNEAKQHGRGARMRAQQLREQHIGKLRSALKGIIDEK